jgi:hypothetical protein
MTIEQMKEALMNSGYLQENRVINRLTELGCFIEPNVTYQDPITNTSREIDIFVDTSFPLQKYKIVHSFTNTYLIFELVNTIYPIAFFINDSFNPEYPSFNERSRYAFSPRAKEDNDSFIEQIVFEDFYHGENQKHSTQYCSFIEKKAQGKGNQNKSDNWMAYHPDELHEIFKKLLHYTDFRSQKDQNEMDIWSEVDSNNRLFYYRPVLLVTDLLFEVSIKNNVDIIPKDHIIFDYSFFYKNNRSALTIDIITEKYLEAYLEIINEDNKRTLFEIDRIVKS